MKNKLLVYIDHSCTNDLVIPSRYESIFTRLVRSARDVVGANSIEFLSFNNNRIYFQTLSDGYDSIYYYVPL